MKNVPTLKKLWDIADEREKKKNKKVKGIREVNVRLFMHWVLANMVGEIHSVIKNPNFHELKWILVRMSYHRFPNICEILQVDLVGKLRDVIRSKDF